MAAKGAAQHFNFFHKNTMRESIVFYALQAILIVHPYHFFYLFLLYGHSRGVHITKQHIHGAVFMVMKGFAMKFGLANGVIAADKF